MGSWPVHDAKTRFTEFLNTAPKKGSPSPGLEAPPSGGVQVTRYLLGTNSISEVRKLKPHGGVLAWIEGLREDQLYNLGGHDRRITTRH
ncbi:MAG: hypothetical protein ABSA57_11835 [Candidatus Acidiferrales bacterium]|jgi:hypothetical protein